MASERILQIRDLLNDYDRLTACVPVGEAHYMPDPRQPIWERFVGSIASVFAQRPLVHMPGSRIVGCGGYLFMPKPSHLVESELMQMEAFPKDCRKEIIEAIDAGIFVITAFMMGHVCVDNKLILEIGINGVIERLKRRLSEPLLLERQRDFLKAAIAEWEYVLDYANRYAMFYRELAQKERDLQRRQEYLEMAQRIEKVPAQPADTFAEALQSMWFTYLCLHAEDIGGHTMGRLDQTLYPYYKRDVERGLLTPEEAEDYFFDFWLKFNMSHTVLETNGERSWNATYSETATASNGLTWTSSNCVRDKHVDDGFVIDLGGLDERGEDGVNAISWLCLRALDELNTLGVKPVIKCTSKTDPRFLQACYETITHGNGFPAITYDDNTIRAFEQERTRQYPPEDLRNICHIGCVELAIPGKSYTDPMNAFMNLPKILLIAMNGGKLDGVLLGEKMPVPQSFAALLEAFSRQIAHFTALYAEGMNAAAPFFNRFYMRPMVSSLMDNCIEKAQLIDEGGARYWDKCMNCCGIADVADSLVAVKKLVFEEKTLTLEEFNRILADNFSENELLRQRLLNRMPKYGNGVEEVDALAKFTVDTFCQHVKAQKTFHNTYYRPGLYSYYGTVINLGATTGALPSGRLQGEILSLNTDPAHGCIKNGLAAALKSITAYDHAQASNASAIDVHLGANTPKEVIAYLCEYIGQHGGLYTQITVADREQMQAAQKDPARYRDLVVRVTGFSARFIALDREVQDEIIRRSYWA